MTDSGSRWQKRVLGLLLGLATMAVFWPALHCGFVYYDDPDYVTSNQEIQHGLNLRSLKWALTTSHAANWHPLTWVSHILDYRFYGLDPAGHHFTSLALHAANAVLLFLLLNRLTGALWRSVFVAAIFALHPFRVESVVWISERKDVLSTFFWLLAVGAYLRYAEEFKVQSSKFKVFYALALLFFALALMAKPMVVTLPFVLLLLDFWPLKRLEFGPQFSWRPVVEKIPFFLLAAADSATTFLIQNHFGVVETLAIFPLSVRLANVPVAYVRYIGKNFWPAGLAIFYPFRSVGLLKAAGAVCLLAAVSVWAGRRWRAQPYLAVGWLWFLGMLVPAIGLVQVSTQAMADRYSYLSSVGLWIMVAWGAADWAGARPVPRALTALAGAAAVVACVCLTPLQIRYWQNSITLFMRAADVTDHNYLAYYNLGCYAKDLGDYPQAIVYFKKAMSAESNDFPGVNQAQAYNNLGYVYLHEGDIKTAVADFDKALALRPNYPEAYFNLGRAFLTNNQPDVAADCFQRALALDPGVAEIHNKLAGALAQLGRPAEALAQYAEAMRLNPGLEQNPSFLGALAAAYAQAGKFPDAAATAQRARQLALAQNNLTLAAALESQLRRYQSAKGASPP
jgi:protein O-mannosyl-transferase